MLYPLLPMPGALFARCPSVRRVANRLSLPSRRRCSTLTRFHLSPALWLLANQMLHPASGLPAFEAVPGVKPDLGLFHREPQSCNRVLSRASSWAKRVATDFPSSRYPIRNRGTHRVYPPPLVWCFRFVFLVKVAKLLHHRLLFGCRALILIERISIEAFASQLRLLSSGPTTSSTTIYLEHLRGTSLFLLLSFLCLFLFLLSYHSVKHSSEPVSSNPY
jgi:hypothetical protein